MPFPSFSLSNAEPKVTHFQYDQSLLSPEKISAEQARRLENEGKRHDTIEVARGSGKSATWAKAYENYTEARAHEATVAHLERLHSEAANDAVPSTGAFRSPQTLDERAREIRRATDARNAVVTLQSARLTEDPILGARFLANLGRLGLPSPANHDKIITVTKS